MSATNGVTPAVGKWTSLGPMDVTSFNKRKLPKAFQGLKLSSTTPRSLPLRIPVAADKPGRA